MPLTPTPSPETTLAPGGGPFVGTWRLVGSFDAIYPDGSGPLLTIHPNGSIRFQVGSQGCGWATGTVVTDGASRLEVSGPFAIESWDCATPQSGPITSDMSLFERAEITADGLFVWELNEEVGMGRGASYVAAPDPRQFPLGTPETEPGLTRGAGPFAGTWEIARDGDVFFPLGEAGIVTLGTDGSITGQWGCNTFTGQVQSDGSSRLQVIAGTGFVTVEQCENPEDTGRAEYLASLVARGTFAKFDQGRLVWSTSAAHNAVDNMEFSPVG